MKAVYTCLLLLLSIFVIGQENPNEPLEQELESIASGNEENETDLVQLAENLALLRENPVEVNFAQQEDFERIPVLNVFQISNLLAYRKQTGFLYSPYELAQIKGFDQDLIQRVLPYLSFKTEQQTPQIKLKNIWKYSRHEFVYRTDFDIERRAGFDAPNGFNGPQGNHYLRYKGRYRDLFQIGVTTQQDPGEPFGGSQSTGVDFLSAHVAVKDYGNLKRLIIGDYQTEFGQGLALWTSLAFGKSAKAVGIKRFAGGVKPFSGSEENRFMRGAAATYRFGSVDVTAFYSRNRIDANVQLNEDSIYIDGVPAVSSLQSTGLHRTDGELEDKDANLLQSIGGNVNYKGNGFSAGATAVQQRLSNPLQLGNDLYRQYQIQGESFTNYSLDFNRLWRVFNMYGEVAFNQRGAAAAFLGVESNVADNVVATLAVRKFDKEYTALYNAPFAENGQSGEQGVYLGVDWQVWKRIRVSAYADHYAFNWPRFRVNAPSRGSDYLVQVEHGINRYVSYYLRYKTESQQLNLPESTLPLLMPRKKQTLRTHFAYAVNSNWKFASRVEYAWFTTPFENSRGFMVFQDVRYYFTRLPLSLSSRVALIEVNDFDARIYAYEHDVLYAFSIPPYYGQSMRFYIMASYAITERIDFQLRYGRFDFFDRSSISSGFNEIDGNTQSEIKAMLKVRL